MHSSKYTKNGEGKILVSIFFWFNDVENLEQDRLFVINNCSAYLSVKTAEE